MKTGEVVNLLDEANALGVRLYVLGGQLRYETTKTALTEEFRSRLRASRGEIVAALSGPAFVSRAEQENAPILDHYRVLLESIRSGKRGVDFSNGTHLVLRYHGCLNPDILRAGVESLVSNHRILSARVINTPAGPQFIFDQRRSIFLNVEDLSGCGSDDVEARAIRRAHDLVWAPIDIDAGPLFRVFALKIADTEYLVGFVVHHFICDLHSVRIVTTELQREYVRQERQAAPTPVRARLQYTDYIAAMNEWLRGADARMRLAYWQRTLAGAKSARIPPDVDPSASGAAEVNYESFQLGTEPTNALEELCRATGVTAFQVVLAAKIGVLSRALASPDVVVVAMLSGRGDPRLDDMIGMTANRVALRVSVSMDMTFATLLSRVHEVCTAAYTNLIPYAVLEEFLQDSGASTTFPLINFIESGVSEKLSGSSRSQWSQVHIRQPATIGTAAQFSAHWMSLARASGGIQGSLGYSSLLYKRQTIRDFLTDLSRLLMGSLRDPDASLLSLMSDPGASRCAGEICTSWQTKDTGE